MNYTDEVERIVSFLKRTFREQKKTDAAIAVSGGIDSALSVALLARAVPIEHIWPLFLPYRDQSIADGQTICRFLFIPEENWQSIAIDQIVDEAAAQLHVPQNEKFRLGNMMARARMICVYDVAKAHDALVCGTENKSEHYLGYFTRFGDAASDIEPICQLYKTQVRQMAEFLQLPEVFLEKAPSAGLWSGQTDESEMGFSYEVADQVLMQLIDEGKEPRAITVSGVQQEVIQKVVRQVEAMKFKLAVPYHQ